MASLVMEFPEFVRFRKEKTDSQQKHEARMEEMTIGELLYFALMESETSLTPRR
jgi:hypothetical protein